MWRTNIIPLTPPSKSAASGRPFLALASLCDPKATGQMGRDDLVHTCKMMEMTLSPSEVEALLEVLPKEGVSLDFSTVDYRVLNNMLSHSTPRTTESGLGDAYGHGGRPVSAAAAAAFPHRQGMLPAYATPHVPTHVPGTPFSGAPYTGGGWPYHGVAGGGSMMDTNRSVQTPLGLSITTPLPYDATRTPGVAGLRSRAGFTERPHLADLDGPGQPGAYDRIVYGVFDRVKVELVAARSVALCCLLLSGPLSSVLVAISL
jgi:hypothetical protein